LYIFAFFAAESLQFEKMQQVLARPHWAGRLTPTDLRAVTPLIESLAIASGLPDNTVLNGSTFASSGFAFTTAGTRSRQ